MILFIQSFRSFCNLILYIESITDSYRQPRGLDSASLRSASLDIRWAVCSLGKNYVKI